MITLATADNIENVKVVSEINSMTKAADPQWG